MTRAVPSVSRYGRALGVTVAVAVAYALAGWFGLQLTIPGGHAGAVYPAAGIALATVLIYGATALPGIVLGSFAMHVLSVWQHDAALASLGAMSGNALGAAVQALVGAALIRRVLGYPCELAREREVFLFLVLGGPVACVVSATFGVAALLLSGDVSGAQFASNWSSWWLGDTLGVVLVAPLVLALFAEPAAVWAPRRVALIVPLLLMATLVVLAYVKVAGDETERIRGIFESAAQGAADNVERDLKRHLSALDSVRRFFDSSEAVDPAEFRTFTQPLVLSDPSIVMVAWAPRVPHDGREYFEARMRRDAAPEFRIREPGTDGSFLPAAARAEYYPVTYVVPWGAHHGVLGLDVSRDPLQGEALRQTRGSFVPAATAPLRLPRAGGRHDTVVAVLLVVPVRGAPAVQGVVAMTLDLREIIRQAIRPDLHTRFEFVLTDLHAAGADPVLYASHETPLRAAALVWSRDFEFAGRTYRASFMATPEFLAGQATWYAWSVLVGGMLIAALLEAYLLVMTGRASRVELLVEERTRALEQSNRELAAQERLLAAIGNIQHHFITSRDVAAVFDKVLSELLAVSDSEYGFIGDVLRDESGRPYLKTIAITDIAWDENSRRFYREHAPRGMEFRNLQSLFGAVLTTGAPVIANDPRHDERGGGVPPGHPPLRAFLGAPLRRGGEMVAMVGIANRPGGYDEQLLRYLQPLLDACVNVLDAARSRQQRIEAETALRHNRELLSEAQRIAHVGYWEWNPRSNALVWSDEMFRILGLAPGSLVPDYAWFVEHMYAEDRARVLEALQGTLAGNAPFSLEFRMCRIDGAVRHVYGAGEMQRDAHGQALRFVGVMHDITERKSVEQQLQRARDAAEQANRAKSEFLSSMSHELRTPLNAILGFAQLLSCDATLGEKQRAQLAMVRGAGEHLLNLINDVLDLSRIEAGALTVFLEDVSVEALLTELGHLAVSLTRRRGLHLEVDARSGAGLVVQADRTRLKQSLLNLVSNAVKYNRDGGSVWVGCTERDDRVWIGVRDTGVGISPEKQAHLFQPFNRLGQERGEVEGTGIGLVITRRLVEMMGGELGFESAPDSGSTFWIEMPCRQDVGAATEMHDAATLMHRVRTRDHARRVLYVEDNPANLEIVRSTLAAFWPRVKFFEAASGETGVEVALRERPDLILMDINLTGIDGYETFRRIRAADTLRDVPVYALTANAMPADIERGLAAGFNGYFTKPLDVAQFVRLVDDVFAGATPALNPAALRRVLIAEDNEVNQAVLRGMVESLGCEAVVVGDGAQAVEAVRSGEFGLVLMDCEMPNVNGYDATRAIRALDGVRARIPVVAVSAQAPHEDAARREQAGMSDVLPKPVDIQRLRAVLERAFGAAPARPGGTVASVAAVLDPNVTGPLQQILGRKGVEVVDSLLRDLPERLQRLHAAVACGDLDAARREAHTMKGSSSNLGAVDFAQCCALINAACKARKVDELSALCERAQQEFDARLKIALGEFRRTLEAL